MALQLRRGTNQQRLGLTPVEGEMIYITDSVLVSISVTGIDTGTETLTTSVEHGLSLNQQIKFIGTTLNGLTKDQVYFVKTTPTTSSFTLSTSLGGGTLNITGTYSVPLVFAKTPCDASGAPIGYTESALWAGDGTTVGGLAVGITNIDALNDVDITEPAVEGEFLWYNGTSWVNENETSVDTKEKTLSLTRRYTSAVKEYESSIAQRLNGRVTNVTNDNTDDAGPALRFERSSGTQYTKTYVSGGAIGAFTVTLNNVTNLVVGNKVTGTGLPQGNGALITVIAGNQLTLDTAFTAQAAGTYTIGAPVGFGQLAFEYFGTTDLHKFKVTTSTDDYLENPTDTYPGTNTLIESTKNYTNINSGVLYVSKTSGNVGINDTGPAYDLSIYKSSNPAIALINAERTFLLTNDASNDQLSFAWGAGNRLQFNTTNDIQSFPTGRLGIGNTNPAYTLDVNGTANVETSLTVPIITTLTGDDLSISAFSGRDVTISTTAAADPVTLVRNTSATSTPVRTITLRADSTGTPAIGFGSQIEFEVETPAGIKSAGFTDVVATNVTSGDETFKMRFGVMNDNITPVSLMELDSLGNLQIDGDLTVTGTHINTGVDNIVLQIDRTVGSGDTQNVFKRTLNLQSTTAGTPAIGYGPALGFLGQTTAGTGGNIEAAGFIAVTATDLTAASEDFKMSFGLMQNGATFAEKMALDSTGYLTATSATFGVIDINTTTGQIDTNSGADLTLDSDGGDVIVNDRLTVNVTLQTPSEDTVTSGNINVGTAMTEFETGASGQTSTLPSANIGQFKTLFRSTTGAGAMVVTVTNAGWKGGASGTITFGNQGDSCLLQYMNDGRWYILGSYDVVIA
jgi:hypothetical protein